MRDKRRCLIAASAFALLAACTSTQQTSAPPQPPADPNAANFTCKRAEAVDVAFATLSVRAEQYSEKCVRVKAFSDGANLYDDAGHRAQALPSFWKDADVARRLRLGPSFVTVVGRVRSCAGRMEMLQDRPHKPCTMAIFVSEAEIIPTAMD